MAGYSATGLLKQTTTSFLGDRGGASQPAVIDLSENIGVDKHNAMR